MKDLLAWFNARPSFRAKNIGLELLHAAFILSARSYVPSSCASRPSFSRTNPSSYAHTLINLRLCGDTTYRNSGRRKKEQHVSIHPPFGSSVHFASISVFVGIGWWSEDSHRCWMGWKFRCREAEGPREVGHLQGDRVS